MHLRQRELFQRTVGVTEREVEFLKANRLALQPLLKYLNRAREFSSLDFQATEKNMTSRILRIGFDLLAVPLGGDFVVALVTKQIAKLPVCLLYTSPSPRDS